MRSHPLLVTLGNATIPSTAAPRDARILEMDSSYQELAEAEGSQIYKAADWRCVCSFSLHKPMRL